MAPTPEEVGAETWIRVSGTVKRGSGLSTANYRPCLCAVGIFLLIELPELLIELP